MLLCIDKLYLYLCEIFVKYYIDISAYNIWVISFKWNQLYIKLW